MSSRKQRRAAAKAAKAAKVEAARAARAAKKMGLQQPVQQEVPVRTQAAGRGVPGAQYQAVYSPQQGGWVYYQVAPGRGTVAPAAGARAYPTQPQMAPGRGAVSPAAGARMYPTQRQMAPGGGAVASFAAPRMGYATQPQMGYRQQYSGATGAPRAQAQQVMWSQQQRGYARQASSVAQPGQRQYQYQYAQQPMAMGMGRGAAQQYPTGPHAAAQQVQPAQPKKPEPEEEDEASAYLRAIPDDRGLLCETIYGNGGSKGRFLVFDVDTPDGAKGSLNDRLVFEETLPWVNGITTLGPRSVAVTSDKSVALIDLSRGKVAKSLPHASRARHVEYMKNHSVLASGDTKGVVRLWNVRGDPDALGKKSQETPLCLLQGHEEEIESLHSFPEVWPNRIFSGANDGTARIWDIKKQRCIQVLRAGATCDVRGISVDRTGVAFVAIGQCVLHMWDARDYTKKEFNRTLRISVFSSFWSRAKNLMVCVGRDGTVEIYDIRKLFKGPLLSFDAVEPVAAWKAHSEWVRGCCEMSGDRFATCSRDNSCRIWNYSGKKLGEARSGPSYAEGSKLSRKDRERLKRQSYQTEGLSVCWTFPCPLSPPRVIPEEEEEEPEPEPVVVPEPVAVVQKVVEPVPVPAAPAAAPVPPVAVLAPQMNQVFLFLAKIKLERYFPKFLEAEVGFDDLPLLLDDPVELERIISKRIPRIKLIREIKSRFGVEEKDDDSGGGSMAMPSWLLDPSSVTVGKQLESVSSGNVFVAVLRVGMMEMPVAVKCLLLEHVPRRGIEHEVQAMQRLKHASILQGLGCWFDEGKAWIVTELCEKGDLWSYLQTEKPDLSARMEMLIKIAAGCQHLKEAGSIHRDLKPENILVNSQLDPKISDFGRSRAAIFAGSVGYMPDPRWKDDPMYDDRFDIYSFAIICWEVIALRRAYQDRPELRGMQGASQVLSKLHEIVLRPDINAVVGVKQEVKSAIEACWNPVPAKRLSFGDLLQVLRDWRPSI